MPDRKGQPSPEELFHIEAYLTEVRVPPESQLAGQTIYYLERDLAKDSDITVLGLIRQGQRQLAPSEYQIIQAEQILLIEGEPEALKSVLDAAGLVLAESKSGEKLNLASDTVELAEAVVSADSRMLGRTAAELDLRHAYGLNVLGVARQGQHLRQQLSQIRFALGDILLLQGDKKNMQEKLSELGCLPLEARGLRLDKPRKLGLGGGNLCSRIAPGNFKYASGSDHHGRCCLVHGIIWISSHPGDLQCHRLADCYSFRRHDAQGKGFGNSRWCAIVSGPDPHTGPLATASRHTCRRLDGHDAPFQCGKQRRCRSSHGTHWPGSSSRFTNGGGSLLDGRGGRSFLGVFDPDRTPIQYSGHGSERLSRYRLSAPGIAALRPGRDRSSAFNPRVLAIATLTTGSCPAGEGY